ncbi:CHAD domain-containing protein [Salmonella enterica]|uniref:CHAD domain-containing protein n=1 Tax=Salmonella enterica subsp. enterica serovar Dessau TaxID=2564349 RepID=A0A8E5MXY6_SALET|nr:CHAD domain-containing protein [Salmonella enterica]QUS47035.1 CHAD domain-containing protein [Salmonella enterica subsp. enterica serovar Dessau]
MNDYLIISAVYAKPLILPFSGGTTAANPTAANPRVVALELELGICQNLDLPFHLRLTLADTEVRTRDRNAQDRGRLAAAALLRTGGEAKLGDIDLSVLREATSEGDSLRKADRRLSRLFSALGDVRDHDVMVARVTDLAKRRKLQGKGLDVLLEELEARRKRARKRLRASMQDDDVRWIKKGCHYQLSTSRK